jgi:methylenetetrahydrofolate dehydrogenase (NADP+)/methenyltetrahydrofolate cyclohydrolase
MTITMLLMNTVESAERVLGKRPERLAPAAGMIPA